MSGIELMRPWPIVHPKMKGIMANLTPASKARCLGVFPCGEGATGEQVASATAGHGQQAARGTQIFSSSRSHSVNCRMIPNEKGGKAEGFFSAWRGRGQVGMIRG